MSVAQTVQPTEGLSSLTGDVTDRGLVERFVRRAYLVLVRATWIFGAAFVPQLFRGRGGAPRLFAHSLVLSWAGMRGVVSLAAALALPMTLPTGGPFPAREALVIVTLTVIVFTLLGQGLTLPWLIRALRLGTDVGVREEEASARQRLLEACS